MNVAVKQTVEKKALTATISEIFSSIQGEGPHVGERHLFVRFKECNLECVYCDEREKKPEEMTVSKILSALRKMENEFGPHKFVSLTGGEPLVYHDFLRSLVPQLKREGFRVYLDTNGSLPETLNVILPLVDVVAMDMKPRSVTRDRGLLIEHDKFLKAATGHEVARPEVFVKMTVSETLDLDEFRQLCEVIRRRNVEIPLILQPADGKTVHVTQEELAHFLMELQHIALNFLKDVRVIARVHKILNLR